MIRYPGSKDKIARRIIREFPEHVATQIFQRKKLEYREPFFGGGAIGFRLFRVLPSHASVWLNDKDYGMVCLWNAVKDQPEELIQEVERFRPTVDDFYKFREEDGRRDMDPVITGFRKFALHQISFSGLGAKAGGPIGGRKQSSEYNVDCRWHATRHSNDIRENHRLLTRFASVRISCKDFTLLTDDAPEHAFIYADPPYYEKGPELYAHSMDDADHQRLAGSLRKCRAPWVLSYDDHPFVRDLYGWAKIQSVALTYTTAVARDAVRRKNSEILIKPPASAEKAA